jgi:uncharacterized cupin superfamily protein
VTETVARYTYPHTIENGVGERITFIRKVTSAGGERLEVENVVKPGAGPPMHIHRHQEEVLTVQEGRIAYQRPGQQPQFAGPGETAAFRPGEAHKFWNAGDVDLRCTGHIAPTDNVEYFLTEFFESTKRNDGRPDPFDAAFLMTRYRSEFTMVEIPMVLQRLVFPALIAVGRMLGRYARFADAPEPVRR